MAPVRGEPDARDLLLGWALIGAVMAAIFVAAFVLGDPEGAPDSPMPWAWTPTPTPDPYHAPEIATPVPAMPVFAPVVGTPDGAFFLPCHPWGMLGRDDFAGQHIAGCEQTCEYYQCRGAQ